MFTLLDIVFTHLHLFISLHFIPYIEANMFFPYKSEPDTMINRELLWVSTEKL